MKITSLGLPGALLATSLFAACQNTARGVEQDTKENTAAAKEAGREAGYKADEVMDRAKVEGAQASEAAKDTMTSLGNKVDAAQQTMDVKTALMADKTVDASGIDVDTMADTKTVTLKGHVKTAATRANHARVLDNSGRGGLCEPSMGPRYDRASPGLSKSRRRRAAAALATISHA